MDAGSPYPPLSSASMPLLVGAGIVIVVAVVGFLAAIMIVRRASRRHARQLAEVVERLERLEQRGALASPSPAFDSIVQEQCEPSTDTPEADVLAGMTSHVRRMVEDDSADPITLADEAIVCTYRHLDEPFAPRELSAELCVSLRSLERGLAAGLGCTPRELIRAVKMREARRLLVDGRLNVAEVASRTGFASPFHFSRSFKSFFGIAPSRARPDVQAASRARRS